LIFVVEEMKVFLLLVLMME